MINAILKEKAEIRCNEDVKTSSIIGLLTLLPSELFWKILTASIADRTGLPLCSGDIISLEFWPHWYVDEKDVDVTNNSLVEPDVYIQFESFSLIIEVKLDGNPQYEEQWTNEVCAYRTNIESALPLFFIALGGNSSLENYTLRKGKAKGTVVHKCSWTGLLEVIHAEIDYLESNPYSHDSHTLRILQMVEKSFSLYGERITLWMESIPSTLVQLDSQILNSIRAQWKKSK